jgi:hypothetical protein
MTYTLLEDTADNTTGLLRTVFQSRGGCVSVQATHGDAKQGAAGEKLLVSVAEAGSLKMPC